MKKIIRPEIIEIQRRFFEALDLLIASKRCRSLRAFCEAHGLNRVKYSYIRTGMRHPEKSAAKQSDYRIIDIDALPALCQDFNVSAEWLLTGHGKMFRE